MKPTNQGQEVIRLAIEKARQTMNQNIGGPFGAAIIDEHGDLLAVASNSVLGDKDPTAHAEVNAIRLASKNLGTHDLSNCTLYTTCYPCPMCLGAIIWANIKKVYYGATPKDAAYIGFRDDFIYEFINDGMQDQKILHLENEHREDCLVLFEEYQKQAKTIY